MGARGVSQLFRAVCYDGETSEASLISDHPNSHYTSQIEAWQALLEKLGENQSAMASPHPAKCDRIQKLQQHEDRPSPSVVLVS